MGYFETKKRFEPLAELLTSSGVNTLLEASGSVTILAPTEVAVESVGSDFLAVLQARPNVEILRRVLRSHIIQGRLLPEDFADGAVLTTVDGTPLPVRRIGSVVLVAGSRVELGEAVERDGNVAYPVGTVVLRSLAATERIALSPSLSRFKQGLDASGVAAQIPAAPRTILAPINDAYTALGDPVLRLAFAGNVDIRQRVYKTHVVPGTPDLVDGATWTTSEGNPLRVAVNGSLRTIGGKRILRDEMTSDGRLLVLGDIILDALNLNQRIRLVRQNDAFRTALIRDSLPLWNRFGDDSAGPFTVFAPSDFAFAQRFPSVTALLEEPGARALRLRVLTIGIFEGELRREDLVEGQVLTTVDGQTVTVHVSGSRVFLDFVQLDEPIKTANGLLYTANSFLPPSADALDRAMLGGLTEFVRAVWRTGLEDEIRTPGMTAFAAPNELFMTYGELFRDVTVLRRALRYNLTLQSIPVLSSTQRVSFTSVDGSQRSVGRYEPPICEPEPDGEPCPPPTPPYIGLEDGIEVSSGTPAPVGGGTIHLFRTDIGMSLPPGVGRPRATAAGSRARTTSAAPWSAATRDLSQY